MMRRLESVLIGWVLLAFAAVLTGLAVAIWREIL